MDTTARDNVDVRTLANIEVVVHNVIHPTLRHDHGDIYGLAFDAWMDANVNPGMIGFGGDLHLLGRTASGRLAVGPDIIGPGRDLINSGNFP